jgi:hypothetical protein
VSSTTADCSVLGYTIPMENRIWNFGIGTEDMISVTRFPKYTGAPALRSLFSLYGPMYFSHPFVFSRWGG